MTLRFGTAATVLVQKPRWRAALLTAFAMAALAGCGRESLLIDDLGGGGGNGGATNTGGGDQGGGGGSTCTPIEELCNTVDDNCNGLVDEGCSCTDGQTQVCYSGPPGTVGVGPCKQGMQVCKNGAWSPCSGETVPISEQCDLVDNNCNGQVDDGNPGSGNQCNIGLQGPCAMGKTKCQNGNLVCAQAVFPMAEVCDGLDNNCNGIIDDGNPGGGAACSTGQPGVCGEGILSCNGGGFFCEPQAIATNEVCDGLDNNCNGAVDEGNPGGGTMCTTGLPGVCAQGVLTCSAGALSCKAVPMAMEKCDGIDNDCNGIVDDVPGLGNMCFLGGPPPCNQGTISCVGGMIQCVVAPNNQPEICDNIDNNCNGLVDEGNPGGGGACSTGFPGICDPGVFQCAGGMVSCVPNASQGPELCAGSADENCDGKISQVIFTETFANNNFGWLTDQEWQIGPAVMGPQPPFANPDPGMDHTDTADNGVAGVVIGGNAQAMPQHPFRWLTSPNIPVDAALPTVYLQFWRWLNSDFAPWMTNRVDVFNATTNAWETVWQSGGNPALQDTMWSKQVYDITAKTKGGFIRLRFGFNIGANGAFTCSQWNVDDIVLTTEPCN